MLDLNASFLIIFAIVWILFFVLKKLFFNPLQKVRGERESLIKQNKEASAVAQAEYERTLSEIDEQIKKARAEALAARDKLEAEAQKEKERLISDVSRESRTQVEKAKEDLERQMKGLLKDMEAKSELLAETIEKRLLH